MNKAEKYLKEKAKEKIEDWPDVAERINVTHASYTGFEVIELLTDFAEKDMKYANVYQDKEGRFLSDEDYDTAKDAFENRDKLSTYLYTISYQKFKDES